jgi:hypothetical protein
MVSDGDAAGRLSSYWQDLAFKYRLAARAPIALRYPGARSGDESRTGPSSPCRYDAEGRDVSGLGAGAIEIEPS